MPTRKLPHDTKAKFVEELGVILTPWPATRVGTGKFALRRKLVERLIREAKESSGNLWNER